MRIPNTVLDSVHFAVVTFGSPATDPKSYYTGRNAEHRAMKAADEAKGTGSCSAARVYRCPTRTFAKTADISVVRTGAGESVVYHA